MGITPEALAADIVNGILNDLTDRRGLRQEWEGCDAEVQAEIRETWAAIVLGFLPFG